MPLFSRGPNIRRLNRAKKWVLRFVPRKYLSARNDPKDDGQTIIEGVVDDLGYLGNRSLYRVRLASGKVVQVSSQNRRRAVTRFLEWEDKVWLSWKPASAVILLD